MIELENVAHVLGAPFGELRAGELREFLAANNDFSRRRGVDASDEIE